MVTMNPSNVRRPEEWAVGCHVRLLTTLDEVVEGTVFAYDRLSNCLTLTQEGETPGTMDVRLLKASYVKTILSASMPETPTDWRLPHVELDVFQSLTSEDAEIPRVTSWEDEVAREEAVRAQKGQEFDRDDHPADRSLTPEQRQTSPWDPPSDRPVARPNPWGRKPDIRQSPERSNISTRPNPWGRKPESVQTAIGDRGHPWGRRQDPPKSPSRGGRSDPSHRDDRSKETTPAKEIEDVVEETVRQDRSTVQPTERPNPWGKRPEIIATSPGDRSNVWDRRPVIQSEKPSTPTERVGPWGKRSENDNDGPQPVDVVGMKQMKGKAYAQVASAKPTPTPTTQAETKTGSAMLTMSLKPRTAMRN